MSKCSIEVRFLYYKANCIVCKKVRRKNKFSKNVGRHQKGGWLVAMPLPGRPDADDGIFKKKKGEKLCRLHIGASSNYFQVLVSFFTYIHRFKTFLILHAVFQLFPKRWANKQVFFKNPAVRKVSSDRHTLLSGRPDADDDIFRSESESF